MYGQPNYFYQQPQQLRGIDFMQPQYQNTGLKGRPVSSIEEVRAAQIDFDGSLFIFPDIANKCIYTKQISATGSAILNKYNLIYLINLFYFHYFIIILLFSRNKRKNN